MLIKAKYEGKDDCILNSDYVIDIFKDKGKIKCYTIDNERGWYEISKESFDVLCEKEEII